MMVVQNALHHNKLKPSQAKVRPPIHFPYLPQALLHSVEEEVVFMVSPFSDPRLSANTQKLRPIGYFFDSQAALEKEEAQNSAFKLLTQIPSPYLDALGLQTRNLLGKTFVQHSTKKLPVPAE